MNNTFDWNRFCKVVHKDLRNLWPSFGTTMLILVALPFALWLLLLVLGGSDISMPADVRLIIIEYLAMFAALMAPSRLYRTWNLRGEGIYFAMLPASKLEKFVSALIYCLVVCPLAVYLGGLALDMVLTALPVGSWQSWIWQGTGGFPFTVDFSILADFGGGEEDQILRYYGSLWFVSILLGHIGSVLLFMFTSTLFKRHKVLQTFLWLYLIQFVLTLILIPVFIALATHAADLAEWLSSLFLRYDEEWIAQRFLFCTIALGVMEIALFGWLSWRRLNRMPY